MFVLVVVSAPMSHLIMAPTLRSVLSKRLVFKESSFPKPRNEPLRIVFLYYSASPFVT